MKKIISLFILSLILITNVHSREILTAFDSDNLFILNEELRKLDKDSGSISDSNYVQNLTFSATDGDTVAWTKGNIILGNGTIYSISAGNTGDMSAISFIYLNIDKSLTALQTTTTISNAVGETQILIAIAENGTNDATFQIFGGSGGIHITGANITVTDLSDISVDVGTITAGSITGTTIQTATGNPKIVLDPDGMTAADGLGNFVFQIETTGTDVGDVTLGQYASNKGAKWDESEEAFMIKGVLTSTSGNIGGWTINANSLSSANNQVILNNDTNNITVGDVNSTYIDITGPTPRVKSSNFASGALGSGWQIGTNLAEFQNIYARGKISTSCFEKETVSSVGGNLLISDSDILNSNMSAADASTLTISGDTTFAVNDILRIADGVDDEWFLVTDITSAPTYTVTRDQAAQYAANTNPIWKTGTAVINYGASGEGLIYMTASEANAPYTSVVTHAGSPWSALTTRARLGNLNGYLGYGTDLYGIAIGEATKYLKYDPTNGLNIRGIVLIEAGSTIEGLDATSVAGWAHGTDATKIDGGDIYTNTITATQIAAGTITATEIATGTITADKYNQLRNTYIYNSSDSLDSSYDMIMPFKIVSELSAIVSIKLSFALENFRAYSTGAASGGGATSGASGSASGGGSTSGQEGGAHYHTIPVADSTVGEYVTVVGGRMGCRGGGGSINVSSVDGHTHTITLPNYLANVVRYNGGSLIAMNAGGEAITSVTNGHFHKISIQNVGDDGASGNSLYYSAGTFRCSGGGTIYTTIANTDHTHTTPDHTHPNHTHTIPAHTHDMVYGIYEDSQSPTINVYIDNGAGYGASIGAYNADQTDIDISAHISGTGWKKIKFTTDVRCRIDSIVECKLDIDA